MHTVRNQHVEFFIFKHLKWPQHLSSCQRLKWSAKCVAVEVYVKFWVSLPRWSEFADFEPLFARSDSAVTPSEKSSINTNRKFTTRFPISLRWSSYVAPTPRKGGGVQNSKTDFHLKWNFDWRKSATKFLSLKTVSDKVVRHSLA